MEKKVLMTVINCYESYVRLSRDEYLKKLETEYGVGRDVIVGYAEMLGEEEDMDALPICLMEYNSIKFV